MESWTPQSVCVELTTDEGTHAVPRVQIGKGSAAIRVTRRKLAHNSENIASRRRRRRTVLERDGYRCVKCGTTENLTLDHIVPLSRGGTHRLQNRQACCQSCNEAKGSSLAGVSPSLIQAERQASKELADGRIALDRVSTR